MILSGKPLTGSRRFVTPHIRLAALVKYPSLVTGIIRCMLLFHVKHFTVNQSHFFTDMQYRMVKSGAKLRQAVIRTSTPDIRGGFLKTTLLDCDTVLIGETLPSELKTSAFITIPHDPKKHLHALRVSVP